MSIFDSIIKLINEHGSASILRERLEQAKEQYALIEKGKADADARVFAIEKQRQDLLQEIQRLKEQLRSVQGANGNPILKVVTTMPEADYATPSDV
jgi:chromosome segregation ATPase